MPEPSRDAYLFAGFLVAVMLAASYLHLADASSIITFSTGAAAFVIGYRMGLPVSPPPPEAPL